MTTNKEENRNQNDQNFQERNQRETKNKINNQPKYIDPDDLGEEDLTNGYGGEDTLDKDFGYPDVLIPSNSEQNKKDNTSEDD